MEIYCCDDDNNDDPNYNDSDTLKNEHHSDLIQNLDEGGLAGLVNGDHLATNVLLRAAHRARFAVSDGSAQKAPRDVNIFVAAEAHASAVSQIIPRGLSFRDGGNVREHHGFKFARVTHGSQGNLGTAGVAISVDSVKYCESNDKATTKR